MLIILIKKYKEIYAKRLNSESILYGLLSSKNYSGKYQDLFKEVVQNINAHLELKQLHELLIKQKEKINNAPFVQCSLCSICHKASA
jgi:hypothetical protein